MKQVTETKTVVSKKPNEEKIIPDTPRIPHSSVQSSINLEDRTFDTSDSKQLMEHIIREDYFIDVSTTNTTKSRSDCADQTATDDASQKGFRDTTKKYALGIAGLIGLFGIGLACKYISKTQSTVDISTVKQATP